MVFVILFYILDALLADLQNSVPGHQQNPLNHPYTGQNGSASSGYGSLRSRQSPQSVSYQKSFENKSSASFKIIWFSILLLQPSFHAVQKDIVNQQTAPVSHYAPTKPTHYNNHNQNGNSGNLSELDTLLQDLSAARYSSNVDKYGSKSGKSSLGSPNALNDSIKRPSVDDLLDELSSPHNSGPVYAVPNRYVRQILTLD